MKVTFLSVIIACLSVFAYAQPQATTVKPGQKAPEIVGKSFTGTTYKLSEVVKGRYVLIDFWASWCRPCRLSNPDVVAMYEKYKTKKFKNAPKGFTVFGVSLDVKVPRWEKAVIDDKLSWEYHVSDLKGWKSKLSETYGIMFIPQAVLVGPDGKVVATYRDAKEAKNDLEKLVK